jgi:hypothetical protein
VERAELIIDISIEKALQSQQQATIQQSSAIGPEYLYSD